MKFLFFILYTLLFASFSFAVVDEPVGCLKKKIYPCAMRSEGIEKIGFFRLGAETSVQLLSSERVRLLEGLVYGENLQGLEFQYGRLTFKLDGDVWIEKVFNKKYDRNPRLIVKNFNGRVLIVKGPLDKENIIPAGFENWYVGYGPKKSFFRGLIRPIVWKGFTPSWVQMLQSKKNVKSKFLLYKDFWREAVLQSSEFYKQVALRGMASVEEKEERIRKEKIRLKKEGELLQKLYRQKNNIE